MAISTSLAAQVQTYAYRHAIPTETRLWPITRVRTYQTISEAALRANATKPRGVGWVHVLWHSGAIQRLRGTGNPKAVQDQLRHRSTAMTMGYLKTLSQEGVAGDTARGGLSMVKGRLVGEPDVIPTSGSPVTDVEPVVRGIEDHVPTLGVRIAVLNSGWSSIGAGVERNGDHAGTGVLRKHDVVAIIKDEFSPHSRGSIGILERHHGIQVTAAHRHEHDS